MPMQKSMYRTKNRHLGQQKKSDQINIGEILDFKNKMEKMNNKSLVHEKEEQRQKKFGKSTVAHHFYET